jgi:hypothetical protein
MRFPNAVHFNGLNDGSVISWRAHPRYLNDVAGLKGNLGKPRKGNKDTARQVGDKKRRSPFVDIRVVVVDYGLQVHGIA